MGGMGELMGMGCGATKGGVGKWKEMEEFSYKYQIYSY